LNLRSEELSNVKRLWSCSRSLQRQWIQARQCIQWIQKIQADRNKSISVKDMDGRIHRCWKVREPEELSGGSRPALDGEYLETKHAGQGWPTEGQVLQMVRLRHLILRAAQEIDLLFQHEITNGLLTVVVSYTELISPVAVFHWQRDSVVRFRNSVKSKRS